MKFIIEAVLAWTLSLIIPIFPFLQGVFIVIICDFIVGITAALYNREKFSWLKLSFFASKIVVFGFVLIAIHQITIILQLQQLNITGVVASIIMVFELKSIDKNVQKLFGISIWAAIRDKFSTLKEIDSSIDNKKDDPSV